MYPVIPEQVNGIDGVGATAMITVTSITRHERRAHRRRKLLTVRGAKLAARLARLDYKTSGESGALKPRSRVIMGKRIGRKNGYAPPPGRTWSRSGPTYVTESKQLGLLPKPVIHYRWRMLNTEK